MYLRITMLVVTAQWKALSSKGWQTASSHFLDFCSYDCILAAYHVFPHLVSPRKFLSTWWLLEFRFHCDRDQLCIPQGHGSLPLVISTDIALWNNSEGQMTMHSSPCSLAYPSPYLSSIILFRPYCGRLLYKYIFQLLPLLQVLFRPRNISFPVE